MSIEKLLREIENYRHKMYELADKKGFTHPEVVYISKQLDELMNEYYSLRYKRVAL